ncbi:hypothetical protein LUZ60_015584 [Juncus effusus]|nr:hypothetical protein LUZ60_015584 [Juncus effusus]
MATKHARDESTTGSDQNIDIVSAVQEFNVHNSKDLSKILKDSENFTLNWKTEDGSSKQIDMEKLATCLPSHLIAVLLSPNNGELDFAYVLSGVRFLHSLADVATRNPRLEQILLDDVKLLEQIMDLVFYCLIVLSKKYQGNNIGNAAIYHTTLGACMFHILTGYISPQYNELALVLLAHPKVEKFVESAFGSLHQNTRLFNQKLLELSEKVNSDGSALSDAIKTAKFLSQQCEASLQFLLSLCQQKAFRDRVLRNKELCKNGGILSLARTILRLKIPDCMKDSSETVASVSRFKSKILSVLLQLCEAETISYLDEVAGSPKSMQLGHSVALEFLNILKTAFSREGSESEDKNKNVNVPRGFLLINALRLVDIFSDDSNFRFSFMTSTVPFMSKILSTPHAHFLSDWCSTNLPEPETDANLDYDPFISSTFASNLLSVKDDNNNNNDYECQLSVTSMPPVSYAQLRTSCVVKIVANLHIFVPNICEEHEKDLFAREFHKHIMQENPICSDEPKEVTVCKNLDSLIRYVKSLTPTLLNDDDVQLLRVFTDTLKEFCNLQDAMPEAQNSNEIPNHMGSIPQNPNLQMDQDAAPEESEDERAEVFSNSQEQKKRRKRNIMNDTQIRIIERALLEEPEMQRNAGSLQAWADTLSTKGQEITSSQLKNWLNNRKARLARVAKESRGGTPDSPTEDPQPVIDPLRSDPLPTLQPDPLRPGRSVSVLDHDGTTEVGTGKVFELLRKPHRGLMVVVDITDLKVDRERDVFNPSDETGWTFEEVAAKNGGVMRVLWDASKVVPLFE